MRFQLQPLFLRMIPPGVNSPIGIYSFDSKARIAPNFRVQCEKAFKLFYGKKTQCYTS